MAQGFESLLAEFIREELKRFHDQMKQHAGAPKALVQYLENLPEFLKSLTATSDLQQRREIYEAIAERVAKALGHAAKDCLHPVQTLCGEKDPGLLAQATPPTPEVARAVQQALLKASVKYARMAKELWMRTLEVWVQREGRVVRSEIESRVSWTDCPSDVREAVLREGVAEVSYPLFPRS